MGRLVELSCSQCSTVFYGVLGRDSYCHICKVIVDFRKAFELEDISVEEIDFKRVREPRWEEVHKDAGKPLDREDWRNYIPEELKKTWRQLPLEAAVLAIMFAEREAQAIDIISDAVVK